MAMRRKRSSDWSGRRPLRSPGRPTVARREERSRFWARIAAEDSSEAQRPKPSKLSMNVTLGTYVQDRLSGAITARDGSRVPGPKVPWTGRRHGPRKPRRWARAWSPQQIARRLRLDFPDDDSMRISHEAIYQALYVQGRGALRRELTACLRTGRALRVLRERRRARGKSFVTPDIRTGERPAEVEDQRLAVQAFAGEVGLPGGGFGEAGIPGAHLLGGLSTQPLSGPASEWAV